MIFDKETYITTEKKVYLTLQIALTGKRIMDQFLEDFKKVEADKDGFPVFGNKAVKGRVSIERNSDTSCFISGYFGRFFTPTNLIEIREELSKKYGCAIVQLIYKRDDGYFVIEDGGQYIPESSDCQSVPELHGRDKDLLWIPFMDIDIPDDIQGQTRVLVAYALDLSLDYGHLQGALERIHPLLKNLDAKGESYHRFFQTSEAFFLRENQTYAFTENMRLLSITERHPVRRLKCALAYFAMRGNYRAMLEWVEHWLRVKAPLNAEDNKNYKITIGGD